MKVTNIVDEDFVNYKKPSMFIGTCYCDFKCCTEAGIPISVCQNAALASVPPIDVPDERILERYRKNSITRAVVVGGMEPLLQFGELVHLLHTFRCGNVNDEFVIYTGYREEEVPQLIRELSYLSPIIVKFGRFIPNDTPKFDDVLGITLASSNQYGKVLHRF